MYKYQLNKFLKISYLLYKISASILLSLNITSEPYLFCVSVIAFNISSALLYPPVVFPSFNIIKYALNPVLIKLEYKESTNTTSLYLSSLGEIQVLFSSFGNGNIFKVVPFTALYRRLTRWSVSLNSF